MMGSPRLKAVAVLATASVLSACASVGELVSAPAVSLSNVEVVDLDFSSQTFRLGFDVSNPNSFPLPVTSVSYGIELDGMRFATGETQGNFTIPANGDGEFAISVELDLLKSAPQLMHAVHDAARGEIPYALKGKLGLDIPLVKPVEFRSSGEVRFGSTDRRAYKPQ